MLCAFAPNFRSNSTRGSGTVETAKPQACEGQNISSVSHMIGRQKLKNSDSFVILFHGPQENIWFQLEDIDLGGFLDEVVLFFCSRSRLTLWSDAAGSLEIPMLCILPMIRTRVGQRVDWHVFCDRTCGIRPNCGCTEIVSLDAASWHWVVLALFEEVFCESCLCVMPHMVHIRLMPCHQKSCQNRRYPKYSVPHRSVHCVLLSSTVRIHAAEPFIPN